MKLVAYNSIYLFDKDISKVYPTIKDYPGIKLYGSLFYLFARNMSIVDRTDTIQIPLNTKKFDFCKVPNLDSSIVDYNDVVNNRAKQLLSADKNIVVMWSGGVDSTLLLSSLVKNSNKEQLKRILVLLSKDSILENSHFYETIVLQQLKVEPSENFYKYIGNKDYLYVTGEGNDQLFASLFVIEAYKNMFGKESPFELIDEEKIVKFISSKTGLSDLDSLKVHNILSKVCSSAPIKIDTIYKYMWWVTLALKWQSVYTRSLLFSNNKIGPDLDLPNNYTTFFHADEFQQWAFNKIHEVGYFAKTDQGFEYKLECKKYIYDLDGNSDYLKNKNKQGSYSRVVMSNAASNYMLEDNTFHKDLNFEDIYVRDNDFV
jgi:hypothetical protein